MRAVEFRKRGLETLASPGGLGLRPGPQDARSRGRERHGRHTGIFCNKAGTTLKDLQRTR